MSRYKNITFMYLVSILITSTIFLAICIGIKTNAAWIAILDKSGIKMICSNISDNKTNFFKWVTDFGDVRLITRLTVVVAGLLIWRKHYNTSVWFLMTILMGTRNIPQILKRIIKRERPMSGIMKAFGYSFPSGHSTAATVFYVMLLILGVMYLKNRLGRMILFVALFTIVFLVMYSRVYLGVHFLSDVLGGFFLGLSITLTSSLIYYKVRTYDSGIDR